MRDCLCSILLTAIRFDPTGLDWGCVKTVSSFKDVRDVETEVDSEPRPQIRMCTNRQSYYKILFMNLGFTYYIRPKIS